MKFSHKEKKPKKRKKIREIRLINQKMAGAEPSSVGSAAACVVDAFSYPAAVMVLTSDGNSETVALVA